MNIHPVNREPLNHRSLKTSRTHWIAAWLSLWYSTLTGPLLGLYVLTAVPAVNASLDAKPTLELQTGHNIWLYATAFLDGDRRLVSSDHNGVLKFWDIASGTSTLTVKAGLVQKPGYRDLVTDRQGRWIAAADFIKGTIYVFDAIKGSLIEILPQSEGVYKLALSSDGYALAARTVNGRVLVWNTRQWGMPRQFKDCKESTRNISDYEDDETYGNKLVAFKDRDTTLLAIDTSGLVKVWQVTDGCLIDSFQLKPEGGYAVMSVSPNGMFAAASDYRVVRIWDVSEQKELKKLNIATDGVRKAIFTEDSKTLAVGDNGKITLIDLATWEQTEIAVKPQSKLLALNSKGTSMAIGHSDGSIELRSTSFPHSVTKEFATQARIPHDIAASADDSILYLATDSDIMAWPLEAGRLRTLLLGQSDEGPNYFTKNGKYSWRFLSGNKIEIRNLGADGNAVNGGIVKPFPEAYLSEDGKRIAYYYDEHIAVRELQSSEPRILDRVRHPPFNMRFSYDSQWLAANGIDGQSEFALFDLSQPSPQGIRLASVTAFDFSRQGSLLLTGSKDGGLSVMDLRSKQSKMLSQPDGREITSVAFDRNAIDVVAGRVSGEIEVYSIATGARERVLKGHQGAPYSLSFGRAASLASRAEADLVRLWGYQRGVEVCALAPLKNGSWIVVTPDGRFDTDNLDEGSVMKWIMPDDPLHALPLEMFMRDYYEPKLLPRVLSGKLGEFKAVRPLQDLNVDGVRNAPDFGV